MSQWYPLHLYLGPGPLSDVVRRSEQLLRKPVERTSEIACRLIGPLHWFPVATDRIVGLSPKVDEAIQRFLLAVSLWSYSLGFCASFTTRRLSVLTARCISMALTRVSVPIPLLSVFQRYLLAVFQWFVLVFQCRLLYSFCFSVDSSTLFQRYLLAMF